MPNPPRPPAKSGKQIAGIPMGWWIAGGVAAVGVVYYSYKHAQVAAVAATPATTDPTLDPNSPAYDPNANLYGDPSYIYGDTSGIAYSGYQGTTPVQTTNTVTIKEAAQQTNADWYSHAVKALAGHGYTHLRVVTSLTNYLLGIPLTNAQVAVVEAATHRIGPPPHPMPIHHAVPPKKKR